VDITMLLYHFFMGQTIVQGDTKNEAADKQPPRNLI